MAGRKLKYDPDVMPKLAEGYAMDGCSDVQIAERLGIGKSTFYKWQKEFPELREAVKKALFFRKISPDFGERFPARKATPTLKWL